MLFDDLLNNPAKWMVESRDEHDIVLTSRIRLARNLTATPFPGWATRQQREETLKLTSGEARQIPVMKGGYYAELSGLTQQQKQLLVERHLISRELAARSEGCAVLISRSQNASILFNEEDHLRLQYILPGIQLKKAWGAISKIDSELEARLPYAYNTRLGYLTACPTNLGTGMRASVMMHLPGLNRCSRSFRRPHSLTLPSAAFTGKGRKPPATFSRYPTSPRWGTVKTRLWNA